MKRKRRRFLNNKEKMIWDKLDNFYGEDLKRKERILFTKVLKAF